MPSSRSARVPVLVATLALVVLIVAGCNRREVDPGARAEPTPIATLAAEIAPTGSPVAGAGAVPSTPVPAGTPVPTPDLSAIEALIKDIDNDLNADESAGPNEGSTP